MDNSVASLDSPQFLPRPRPGYSWKNIKQIGNFPASHVSLPEVCTCVCVDQHPDEHSRHDLNRAIDQYQTWPEP